MLNECLFDRYLFSLMAIVMLLDQTMCSVNVNYDEIHGQPLKTISVGYSGVWGVEINNSNSDLYYRTGTYDNQSSIGSAWERVNGGWIHSRSSFFKTSCVLCEFLLGICI